MPEFYYPQSYQPYQNQQMMQRPMPQMAQAVPSQNSNSIMWVQGEAGAKAYPVAPNNSILLMDSEESVFYIKSTDASGIPQPLRIFDYKERTHQASQSAPKSVPAEQTNAVTREEFERLKEDVTRLSRGIRKPQMNNKDKED